MTYNLKTKEWKLFAEGLQLPLGILAVSNSEVLVMQLSNLIRIKDTDGDGHADMYENATGDFGISGNYHEFNYGPVRDKAGNLFIALNNGSSGGGVRPVVRGELNKSAVMALMGTEKCFRLYLTVVGFWNLRRMENSIRLPRDFAHLTV